ncbi:hypothetical protein [Algoriphagus sp. PAP.12]|uniref:hypothetical protein n=1 Tax=Algoriphagus sp. PAP.12 TaxID=2996678 RepID=UPI00227D11DA|nr:hypothetical protein [Algoriphagus sp. PAP.12]
MKKFCRLFTVIATVLFVFTFRLETIAQSAPVNKLGLSLLGESFSYKNGISPSIGFIWDRKVKGHNGFETGLFFRTSLDRERLFTNWDYNNTTIYDVRENYITIPILYKYSSDILNVSGGLSMEYYLGWKQTGGEPIGFMRFSDAIFDLGPIIKIGRTISMGGNLVIEPEIRLGNYAVDGGFFYGAGLQIKNILTN